MRGAVGTGVVGLVLLAAAGLLDAEPLYPPGVGLLVLALAAAGWVALAAHGAAIARSPLPARLQEDEAAPVTLTIRPGLVRAPHFEVDDPLAPAAAWVHGPVARTRLSVSFARRGRRVLPPPRLRVRDPLGLAEADVEGPGPADELLVLPGLAPVEAPSDGGEGPEALAGVLVPALAVEVDGLRPYRPGTPAARIHWPALARGAGLLERRIAADAEVRPLVALDARSPTSEAALDAAVRAAASLARALARAGGCALLLAGDRRPTELEGEGGAWPLAHARLALVEPGGPAPVPSPPVPRRGAVVLVAGRPLSALPPGLAAVARGPRVVVVPGEAPGAAFRVAGCSGMVLGGARRRAAA